MEPKVDCPPRNGTIPARPPAVPPLSERLKQLEDLHARGAISDTEYSAQRLHIIASM
ncbi:MAG TPA: SHOCT domain-containing protein [Mycobacterium sp.]|nr:SHOCT domain-containing protein [Mycobacterium sp.]HTX95576.1 SHOCT domain-containing protein [Mycobacterium sp.]